MLRNILRRLSVALTLALLALPVLAETDAEAALAKIIRDTETGIDARVGVFISDSASDWYWGYRRDERFLMASTFKSLLCGAVLAAADLGDLSLDETLEVRASEVHGHAPVTEDRIGQSIPIRDLCLATLDLSDNGAANLLLDRLGGPQQLTEFLRGIGDDVTRLDRKEPDLNIFAPGDPRDTTSPAAMASTWEVLLLGDVLSDASRQQLADWMSYGAVTGELIRAHLPQDWIISDRSGGGRQHTRNIIAMITPPGDMPYFAAIYLSDTPADWGTRNTALSDLGAAVIGVIKERSDRF